MGLGAVVIGWVASGLGAVGVGGTIGAGIATVVGSAITGALIGAAVGGLTAAVTGGDIGKGMLTGAIGGAVLGGLSGAWDVYQGTQVVTKGMSGLAEGVSGPSAPVGSTVSTKTGMTVVEGGEQLAGNVAEGVLKEGMTLTGDQLLQTGGQIVKGAAEGYLGKGEGIDFGEQAAAQMMIDKQKLEAESIEAEKARAGRMKELDVQLAQQLDISKGQTEEQRRQFDVSRAAELARQRDAAASRGVLTIGKGAETTAGYDPDLTYELLKTGEVG